MPVHNELNLVTQQFMLLGVGVEEHLVELGRGWNGELVRLEVSLRDHVQVKAVVLFVFNQESEILGAVSDLAQTLDDLAANGHVDGVLQVPESTIIGELVQLELMGALHRR